MAEINKGIDVESILQFKEMVKQDVSKADRNPTLVAHWVDGDRSRVEYGDKVAHLGGDDGEFNAMQMLLGALAACDVDLVSMHASIMGLKINSLSVEASGHFNVQSYLGIEDTPGSGYDQMGLKIYLDAPDATQEQIDYLIHICEAGSPVGDSLTRIIPVELEFVGTAEKSSA